MLVTILTLQVFLFGEILTQAFTQTSFVPQTELVKHGESSNPISAAQLRVCSESLDTSPLVTSNLVHFSANFLIPYDRLIHTQLVVAKETGLRFDFPIFVSRKTIPRSSKKEALTYLFLS